MKKIIVGALIFFAQVTVQAQTEQTNPKKATTNTANAKRTTIIKDAPAVVSGDGMDGNVEVTPKNRNRKNTISNNNMSIAIVNTWEGTWGSGNIDNPNFYSFKFNTNNTMQLLDAGGATIANGTYTFNNNEVKGTYTYNQGGQFSISGTLNGLMLTGSWGGGTDAVNGGKWKMTSKASSSLLIGKWVGTWGNGSNDNPNYYCFKINADKSMNLLDANGAVIATGTYTNGNNTFNATYRYGDNNGPQYSVAATIVGQDMSGTWGSGTNVTNGGKYKLKIGGMNTNPNPANFPDASVQRTLPDGKKLFINMTKNVNNIPTNIDGVVKEQKRAESNSSEGRYDKKVITKTINAESNSFMDVNIANQSTRIYPGAIYDFSSFFSGGMPVNSGRNPFTIYADNTNNTSGSLTASVADGQASTIYDAIRSITTKFSTTTGSANLQYRSFKSVNDADLSIKISASGAYAGFSASGGYNLTSNETTIFLTIDAIKPLYSISTQVPSNGFFTDPNMTGTAGFMIVNRVTYGTRILANLKITIKKREDAVNFAAKYGVSDAAFVAASFGLIKNNSSVESTVNAYVIGGPITATTFSRDNLEAEIQKLLSQCNYQTAQPISYSFSDLAGNQLGAKSATDEFQEIITTPKDAVYHLAGANVEIFNGQDGKDNGSNVIVDLFNGVDKVFDSRINNAQINGNSIYNFNLTNYDGDPNAKLLSSFQASDDNRVEFYFQAYKGLFGVMLDEWDINKVKLTLNFVDQFGNPYNGGTPTVITFSDPNTKLKPSLMRLKCYFDRNLKPTYIQTAVN
jgi:hypothetical protein